MCRIALCSWLFLAALLPLLAADDAAPAVPVAPGTRGAIHIPLTMPVEGKASIGLYTAQGQLVRILGQMLPLARGRVQVYWDGLDLWGNLLPAGTTLTARLVASPGVHATYEFSAAQGDQPADHVPWLTKPLGEGAAQRTGGWLGDHTPPSTVVALGDRVFIGSKLVEHGHGLIACDLQGNKLWGINGLEGWQGPEDLLTDGTQIIARRGNKVWRLDPATYARQLLCDTSPNPLQAIAASTGRLHLLLGNAAAVSDPFPASAGAKDMVTTHAVPAANGTSAPEFQLSGQARLTTVFTGANGHFQTGLVPRWQGGTGVVILPFATARTIGTVVLGRLAGAASCAVYTLAPGTAYDPAAHEPDAEALGAPEMPAHWQKLGATPLSEPLSFVTAAKAPVSTQALLLRFTAAAGVTPGKDATFTLCRLLATRVAPALATPKVSLPPGAVLGGAAPAAPATTGAAWRWQTADNIDGDSPALIELDYGQNLRCDGLLCLNNTCAEYVVEAAGAGTAETDGWGQVCAFKAGYSSKGGSTTASTLSNAYWLPFTAAVETGRLRLRCKAGYKSGRVGLVRTTDDPKRLDCEYLVPVRLLDPPPNAGLPPQFYREVASATGQTERELPGNYGHLDQFAAAPDGTLYTTTGTTLNRTRFSDGHAQHTALAADLQQPTCLLVAGERLMVGEGGPRAVSFFDLTGKRTTQLGGQPDVAGPWDRRRIRWPSGVAVDRLGKVWVAEGNYQAKRVARFSPGGTCEWEVFGPPAYGGGGWLDAELKSFYYRGVEYGLDWAQGRSKLLNFNDLYASPASPVLDNSSFAYTAVGRPIRYQGREYLVGDPGWQMSPGVVICLKAGAVWRPCVVMGSAKGARFLIDKPVWKEHWRKQDLQDCLFIWTDRQGDGQYRVEDVEVFKAKDVPGNPFNGSYWGSMIAADLTVWSPSARLAPTDFSPAGVPRYERSHIQAINYAKLAPLYDLAESNGSLAKKAACTASLVAQDGSLSIGVQPYRVLPDGTLAGGPLTAKPSDYLPHLNGRVTELPLHYAGSAVTKSPVGEVGLLVGDGGVWSIFDLHNRLLLDTIFTGAQGGWGSDLAPTRGQDVTGRRHDQETFFGHFIRADNGQYYTVAGKGFHGLCQITGLDDFQVTEARVEVTPAALAANQTLRGQLVAAEQAREQARKNAKNRQLDVPDVAQLTDPPFKFDGQVQEYGKGLKPLVDPRGPEDRTPPILATVARSADGLYLAYRGRSGIGHHSDDPRFLFSGGFALDFAWGQSDKEHRSAAAYDRRLVLAPSGKTWTAVRYDYVDPQANGADGMIFSSPVGELHVAHVTVLPAAAVTVHFALDDLAEPEPGAAAKAGETAWSAEVFVPWATLGWEHAPAAFRGDLGVLLPDSGGQHTERRLSWGANGALPTSDIPTEAQIFPDCWGLFNLK